MSGAEERPAVRFVGIDPGFHGTGLCCLGKDPGGAKVTWIGSDIVKPMAPTEKNALNPAQRQLTLIDAIEKALRRWGPGCVVLEEPRDMRDFGGPRARDTSFGIGAAYMAALAAAHRVCGYRVVSYTIEGQRGWMPRETTTTRRGGRLNHVMKSERLVELLKTSARTLTDNPLTKDELMAYGVVMHHIDKVSPATL